MRGPSLENSTGLRGCVAGHGGVIVFYFGVLGVTEHGPAIVMLGSVSPLLVGWVALVLDLVLRVVIPIRLTKP